jgi:hypothetical protein
MGSLKAKVEFDATIGGFDYCIGFRRVIEWSREDGRIDLDRDDAEDVVVEAYFADGNGVGPAVPFAALPSALRTAVDAAISKYLIDTPYEDDRPDDDELRDWDWEDDYANNR